MMTLRWALVLIFLFILTRAFALRDPFQKMPLMDSCFKHYKLSDFHYVGYLCFDSVQWALIQDPTGRMYKVTVGSKFADQVEIIRFDASHLWAKSFNKQPLQIKMTSPH